MIMVLLISLFLISVLIFAEQSLLKTKTAACYAVCCVFAVLSVVLYVYVKPDSSCLLSLAMSILTKGGLSGALFLYVMFTGALPAKSRLRKKLLPVRTQLAVMGSILAIGHGAAYGSTYLIRFFAHMEDLRLCTLLACCCSIALLLLLLPLFITSFYKVRRKMTAKTWKRLQRMAYGFYGLVYLHILFFRLPAIQERDWEAAVSVCLYSILFFSYAVLRLSRLAVDKHLEDWIVAILLGGMAMLAAVLWVVFFLAPGKPAEQPAASKEEEIQTTQDSHDQDAASWKDGTYTGSAIGYNGKLKVSVEIENGTIKDISLKSHVEDEPYVTRAVNGIFPAILETNETEVDAVSTATTTSEALISAVEEALNAAGQ